MKRSGGQYKLFDEKTSLPTGFRYYPNFISEEEEELLISFIEATPLVRARVGEYVGRRHVKDFGWGWDEKHERFVPGPPLPRFLQRFARRIAKWLDISPKRVVEALVNEYPTGTGLGWHRDNEKFEHVVGISLSSWCRMRFRPMPSNKKDLKEIISFELEPRSVYVMQKDIRWDYQHSVAATRALRYSITFRTLPKEYPFGK